MNTPVRHSCGPRQNQLLAALSDVALSRWQPHLEPVDLQCGQVLCDRSSTPAFVYFPTTAVVSLLCSTQDGDSAEIAVVGNDGMVGVPLFMGSHAMPTQAVVQSAGHGYRLRAQAAKREVNRDRPVLDMLLRYAQSVIAQVAQIALCNRYHTIDQQLCRRLLLGLGQVGV